MGDARRPGAGAAGARGGGARCREEVKAGRMSQGQAHDARHDAALKLKVKYAYAYSCSNIYV